MTIVWIMAAVAALLWLLTLRLSVRLVNKELDNGWDNAVGYGIVSALMLSVALSMLGMGWLAVFAPLVLWGSQTGALAFIYEVRPLTAFLLGALHTALFSAAAGATTVVGGAIAIYLMYGKIVADPMVIIRIILRWLGWDWPAIDAH